MIVVPAGIDSELAVIAARQPDLDYADPVAVRRSLRRSLKLSLHLRAEPASGVTVQDQLIPVRDNASVNVRIYRPAERIESRAALLFFHGGAFVAGDLDTEHMRCVLIAGRTGILIVSVDYRLAPEHRFPAGFHDCYDALLWTVDHATELGIDSDKIAVGGSSAGGALAAAVCLAARDLHGPAILYQMLLYPVIDDAMNTPSMSAFTATPGWNQPNTVHMWSHYLSCGEVSAYAAPGRATNLAGLPSAYVLTAEFDPLRDEGVRYASRLLDADVATELHHFPGAFHGFDAAAPDATLSRRSLNEQCAILLRACRASDAS